MQRQPEMTGWAGAKNSLGVDIGTEGFRTNLNRPWTASIAGGKRQPIKAIELSAN
jgi:hypothetical protein